MIVKRSKIYPPSARIANNSEVQGFTLAELIVGVAVASVVVSSTVALTSAINRSTLDANTSTNALIKTDSILNQITDEIQQSESILTRQQDLPSGCSAGGGNFLIAFALPPQAYDKSEYDTATAGNVVKTKAQQNAKLCPIVLGTRASRANESGPYVLYRYGPDIDDKGFYINTSISPVQQTRLIDGIGSSPLNSRRSCKNGWSSLTSYGVEACVDNYARTALLSVSRATDTAYSPRSVKRSAAASVRSLTSSLAPSTSNNSSGGGKPGNGWACYMGSCGPCDGTTYLIDRSGSMNWGRNRMQRAKNDLINTVKQCLANGGGRINIMWFTGGSYGSYRPNTNVNLTKSNINDIINYIRSFSAGGGTNPWPAINHLIQARWNDSVTGKRNDYRVKRIVVLTDGGTSTSGNCFAGGGRMLHAQCYQRYNANQRVNDNLKIDSVALDTRCSYWLQALSDRNGGTCRQV